MKGEMKCDGDQQNSLSKEERKQKKEERRKKKKERLDKENTTQVEHVCEDASKNTLPEVVTENSKKKHKRKKHQSDSVGDDTVSDGRTGEHSINEGKIKRQKTEDIDQTTNNCGSSPEETKSKKKKRKKEKTIAPDALCDASELPGDRQDVTQSAKKKKHKKAKTELADGEKVESARTVSLLETDGDTTHERKAKKHKRVSRSLDETIEDPKHTDIKENNSSPDEEESSKCKEKKKKHSKHEDCEPVHEADTEIPREKHKKKSKSTSSIKGELHRNTEHNSVETQDITKHVKSNADISQTSDKGSKHKKQKHHSKNSPVDSTDNNFNGKHKIHSEVAACDKPTPDVMTKPELSPAGTSATLGNWQGNLFENNERQNKFLRLLGGMKKTSNATAEMNKHSATLAGTKKKGLFGSLVSLSNTGSSGGNTALDVNAAANLNQKLEDEYNKALNFKLSGKVGTGFGFVKDPAEGKKFHIDVSKSKSVKFNDD